MEVCVNGIISIFQAKSIEELRHATRSLLYGIESIFPNGVSINKLLNEGKWKACKETLGEIFDRITWIMKLPKEKS